MDITKRQKLFIYETLKAIIGRKARVGKEHYSITISRLEMTDIINKLRN